MIRLSLAALLLSTLCAAEVANMSGSWWLSPKRSRWEDNKRPPNSVALDIQHSDPKLKYEGVVNGPGEDAPKKFSFDGAIDGKEYTATEDQTQRRIAFKRKSDRVVESISTLPDGRTKEYSTLTMSSDGSTLERKMQVRDGDRVVREWVEIYEKRR